MQSSALSSFARLLKKKTGPLLFGRANKQLSLHLSRQEVDLERASEALSWGANPNQDLYRTLTPLVHAQTRSNAAELTRLLLSEGADPNLLSKSGDSPLHAAAQSLNIESAIMLIAAGADDTLLDGQGISIEDRARRARPATRFSSYSYIQMILDQGSLDEVEHRQNIASFLAHMEAAKIQKAVVENPLGTAPSTQPEIRKLNRL